LQKLHDFVGLLPEIHGIKRDAAAAVGGGDGPKREAERGGDDASPPEVNQ
jgi:hypothetical protein